MPTNPNISLAVKGIELQDPLAQYGKVMAIQGAQQQNQLAQLQMREAQATAEERNALRQLDPTSADYENQLFRVNPKLALEFRKEAAATAAQKAAQAKSEFDLKAAQRKFGDDLKRGLSANPSDENIIAFGQDAVLQGLYTPDQVRSTVSQLLALPPQDRVRILSQAGATAGELKPSIQQVNQGGQTQVLRVPAYSGAPAAIGTYADVAAPPEVVAQKAAIAAASRAPKEDETKVIAQTVYDAAGTPTFLNKFGQVITPVTAAGAPAVVKGKPSATFEKTTAQRKQLSQDIDRAITELTSVTQKGGLIDQATGSGIGRAVDVGAGIFGKATPGAIAIGKLAPVADMVLKMVPRFEGPQSNKDTQSYKEAAGQLADPTLPNEIRKQAGLQILRLMKDRKGQFVTPEMAAEGIAPGAAPGAAPAATLNIDALLDKYK